MSFRENSCNVKYILSLILLKGKQFRAKSQQNPEWRSRRNGLDKNYKKLVYIRGKQWKLYG